MANKATKNNPKGFVHFILIIVLAISIVVVAGYFTYRNVKQKNLMALAESSRSDIFFSTEKAPTPIFRYDSLEGIPVNTPVCFVSGYTSGKTLQKTSWDMSPFTGYKINDPRDAFQQTLNSAYYGSSGCQAKGNQFGYMLNSFFDANGTSPGTGIRTAQMYVKFNYGTIKPWSSAKYGANPKLRLETFYKKKGGVIQNGANQQTYMYVGLVDSTTMQSFWYTMSLWDSRGSKINDFPPILSDQASGGGTTNFNVLGNLNDGTSQSKLVSRHWASQSTSSKSRSNTIPDWYAGYITKDNLKNAISSANAFIDAASPGSIHSKNHFSTNPEDYSLTAFAVDTESDGKGPKQDWVGLSSWSSKVMTEY